jgi:hypothetical protein
VRKTDRVMTKVVAVIASNREMCLQEFLAANNREHSLVQFLVLRLQSCPRRKAMCSSVVFVTNSQIRASNGFAGPWPDSQSADNRLIKR